MNQTLVLDKRESQKQWDGDPCGANTADASAPGTVEFYRSIRRHRYEVYAPWLQPAAGFADWRNKDVLEIGVGMGSDHLQFARNGNRMTGLDLSQEHLQQTARHLEAEGLATRRVIGDAENIPFPDASFDLVYTFGVLHHTPDTAAAVREIHRVLRPGGQVTASVYHRHSAFFWLKTMVLNGLLRGVLFRQGYRRLLSNIEYRRDAGSACPLVKVYSRSQVARLFGAFSRVSLRTAHLEVGHFARAGMRLPGISRARLEQHLSWLGWYVVVTGTKADA